ncbi:MAG: exodeoxyribonuclease VII large subunit [Saprospiraceae bacterium]
MQSYTLFEINEFIRQVLSLNLPEAIWVQCELAQVKASRGHFFIDLVQKKDGDDEILAQGQAVLWQQTYRQLSNKLGLELQALLQPGIEVKILVHPEFHERYGLKFNVRDFDTAYTFGKLEMKRQDTIRRLKESGLLKKNKSLPLPPVLQRLAVVTSDTAAGYHDFLQQLENNPYGYTFRCRLFSAAVQGIHAGMEISAQLKKIGERENEFDAVVIIRGGGAKLDLAAFDEYDLCETAAHCPLPVLTGIGHEVDETVMDLLVHTPLKTPTAVAEYILQRNMFFESEVLELARLMKDSTSQQIQQAKLTLHQTRQRLQWLANEVIQRQAMLLDYIGKDLPASSQRFIKNQLLRLQNLENELKLLSPESALRRGFSLVLKKGGQVVKNSSDVQINEELEIVFHKGKAISTVKKLEHE